MSDCKTHDGDDDDGGSRGDRAWTTGRKWGKRGDAGHDNKENERSCGDDGGVCSNKRTKGSSGCDGGDGKGANSNDDDDDDDDCGGSGNELSDSDSGDLCGDGMDSAGSSCI